MEEKVYRIGKSKLIIKFGSITTTNSQVIVSSDDYYLSMGGGVSRSILEAGGNQIAIDAAKKVPAKLGDVIVTTAGKLNAKFVFHAITIGKIHKEISPPEIVKSILVKCLDLLTSLNLQTIAFPVLGAGAARFSYEDVSVEMSKTISQYLSKSKNELEVTIFLFDRYGQMKDSEFSFFFDAFSKKIPSIARKEILVKKKSITKKRITKQIKETEFEITLKRINGIRVLLGTLQEQRYNLEIEYVKLIGNENSAEIKRIKLNLKENEKFRLEHIKELEDLKCFITTKNIPSVIDFSKDVFVSSTYSDLVEYRKIVMDQISKRKMDFIGMEHFGADPNVRPPSEKIREAVGQAKTYVGIYGVRYGSIDPSTGMSMTELEYHEAKAKNLKMLIYIMDENVQVSVKDIEKSEDSFKKMENFKNNLKASHTCYFFKNKDDLGRQVFEDLGRIN